MPKSYPRLQEFSAAHRTVTFRVHGMPISGSIKAVYEQGDNAELSAGSCERIKRESGSLDALDVYNVWVERMVRVFSWNDTAA